MGENENNISLETKLVFTIKSFLSTIGAILAIFASFYFMVINPRIDKAEENASTLLDAKMEIITSQFDNLNVLIEKDHQNYSNGIKSALDASTANTQRFKDVAAANSNVNSGGSNSTSSPASVVN